MSVSLIYEHIFLKKIVDFPSQKDKKYKINRKVSMAKDQFSTLSAKSLIFQVKKLNCIVNFGAIIPIETPST